jgi:hypothetical protein
VSSKREEKHGLMFMSFLRFVTWADRLPVTITEKVKYCSGTYISQKCAVLFLNHMFQKLLVLQWQGYRSLASVFKPCPYNVMAGIPELQPNSSS